MIESKNRQSLMWGVPGLLSQWAGMFCVGFSGFGAAHSSPGLFFVGLTVSITGTVCLGAGMCLYAQAKGRSAWLGLLGFFGLIGLIILACLDDRARDDAQEPADDGSMYAAGPPPRNTPARLSVYFGLFSALPLVGFLTAIVGLVLGIMGLRKSRSLPRRVGRGAAWAGILLSVGLSAGWVGLTVAMTMAEASRRATRLAQRADDAAVGEHSKEYIDRVNNVRREYDSTYEEFLGVGGFEQATLTSLEDLERRITLLERLLHGTEQMTRLITPSHEQLRSDFMSKGVSRERADREAAAFLGVDNALALRMRDGERQLWVSYREKLTILKKHWGHWEHTPEGEVLFDEGVGEDVIRAYNDAAARCGAAVKEIRAVEKAQNEAAGTSEGNR